MPERGLTTEFELSIAVLKYLDSLPTSETSLDNVRRGVGDFIELTDGDVQPSTKRVNAKKWEEQLDAIIANKDADGNFISRGFFFHRPLRLAITESGRFYLHDRILRK